jgi:hypothetical protein
MIVHEVAHHPAAKTRERGKTARRGGADTFARDRLPPKVEWPELDLSHPAYRYPARLNCVGAFLDRWLEAGAGERLAFVTPAERWSYRRLFETVNRIARVLVEDLGLVPGVLPYTVTSVGRASTLAAPLDRSSFSISIASRRVTTTLLLASSGCRD